MGDLLPFLALGRALGARGHTVRMAVSPTGREACVKAGLEFVPCGKPFGPEEVRARADVFDYWNPLPLDQSLTYLRSQNMAETCRELESACQGADLMIASTIQGIAPYAHERTGIPWISACLNASDYPHADVRDPARERAPTEEERRGHRALLELHNEVRCEAGLKPHDLEDWPERLPVDYALLASSVHFSRPTFPEAPVTRQTGFWFGELQRDWAPPADLLHFLAAGDPPLVLSLSSLPVSDPAHVVRVHAQAAALLGLRLLMLKGWAGLDGSGLPDGIDPSRVHVASYVPHDWLFARSAALIHHGGIGTLARGLLHGLPMLVEPYGNDQFFNAQRAIMLGVGAAMHPHKLTAEGIARILKEKVLLPQARQQALEVGSRLKAEDGLTDACLLIERALRKQPWN
ncbi:MAG: glycosyltransferase family 1 protein [Planctomycetota bacterium]|nr:glycosyltransferase family 1 protein [Planctomycetota bacterium]